MKFNIRKVGIYKDVSIQDGGAIVDLGFLSEQEVKSLIATLEEAVDELSDGLDTAD